MWLSQISLISDILMNNSEAIYVEEKKLGLIHRPKYRIAISKLWASSRNLKKKTYMIEHDDVIKWKHFPRIIIVFIIIIIIITLYYIIIIIITTEIIIIVSIGIIIIIATTVIIIIVSIGIIIIIIINIIIIIGPCVLLFLSHPGRQEFLCHHENIFLLAFELAIFVLHLNSSRAVLSTFSRQAVGMPALLRAAGKLLTSTFLSREAGKRVETCWTRVTQTLVYPGPVCVLQIRQFHYLHGVYCSDYNMACPGNRLRWDLKKEDFPRLTDELIATTKAVYDKVAALSKDDVTYDNVIKVCQKVFSEFQKKDMFQINLK